MKATARLYAGAHPASGSHALLIPNLRFPRLDCAVVHPHYVRAHNGTLLVDLHTLRSPPPHRLFLA